MSISKTMGNLVSGFITIAVGSMLLPEVIRSLRSGVLTEERQQQVSRCRVERLHEPDDLKLKEADFVKSRFD